MANKKEEMVSIVSIIGVGPAPCIHIAKGAKRIIEIILPFIASMYFIVIIINNNLNWFKA